jgi:flavin reductase (DIM6/NTAB) family NADH-FMN oxidoreductase RutF
MRHRHPGPQDGETGGRHRQFDRRGDRQVHRLRPDGAAGEKGRGPLIAECFANLECRVADRALVRRYNLFILEAVQAWIDPKQKTAKTIHHQGYGRFAVDGPVLQLDSRMR